MIEDIFPCVHMCLAPSVAEFSRTVQNSTQS